MVLVRKKEEKEKGLLEMESDSFCRLVHFADAHGYFIGIGCVCDKVLGGSMEQTHQFEYIELHVEINLSILR
jgi:hypothetical protein